jgi:hypothetical protein
MNVIGFSQDFLDKVEAPEIFLDFLMVRAIGLFID